MPLFKVLAFKILNVIWEKLFWYTRLHFGELRMKFRNFYPHCLFDKQPIDRHLLLLL